MDVDPPRTTNGLGIPLATDDGRTCGDCSWSLPGKYSERILRCLRSDKARVESEWPACERAEFDLDCQACGACCGAAFSEVVVEPEEPFRKKHPELLTWTRVGWVMDRKGVDCVVLKRTGGACTCTLYGERPQTCRDFQSGTADCLAARQRTGVTAKVG